MDDADSALAGPAFGYVDFGVANGLSRDALMKAAGLDERLRQDPDARVSTMTYMVLWRELLTGLPGVAVPIEYVRTLDLATLGVGGQIMMRADDLAHAADLSVRFSRLTDTAVAQSWIEEPDRIGYTLTHRPEVVALRFPIEVMLGTGYRVMCHAAGEAIPLREVTFAHAAGYPVAAYESFFGCPVRFSASASALWLDRDVIRKPFSRRDPLARRYLEAHAEQMLAALPTPQPPVIAQIREAIMIELATSGAELARVAKRVAMSTRTVQRRLEEQGTSYQDVVDDVRSALARALLRDRARSIIDVAFELGYADLKSFYRAFRRWTNTTPAEWRASPSAHE